MMNSTVLSTECGVDVMQLHLALNSRLLFTSVTTFLSTLPFFSLLLDVQKTIWNLHLVHIPYFSLPSDHPYHWTLTNLLGAPCLSPPSLNACLKGHLLLLSYTTKLLFTAMKLNFVCGANSSHWCCSRILPHPSPSQWVDLSSQKEQEHLLDWALIQVTSQWTQFKDMWAFVIISMLMLCLMIVDDADRYTTGGRFTCRNYTHRDEM